MEYSTNGIILALLAVLISGLGYYYLMRQRNRRPPR
ncbi:hypothetical protein BH24BAC1_BH24BAC1_24750 [soil metagenome]